jgi:hypothetical protein
MARPTTRRELVRRFRKLGSEGPISGGKHQFMKKGALKVRIPNPHKGGDVDAPLLKEILGQAGIPFHLWEKL